MHGAPRDAAPVELLSDDKVGTVPRAVRLLHGAEEERVESLRLFHRVRPGLPEHRLRKGRHKGGHALGVRRVAELVPA
ncbi:MAG: hypothetical protein ACK55I_34860, partial [bacterium]